MEGRQPHFTASVGEGHPMPWEHSLWGGVGPKGRVSLSGQILANWPLLCDMVSSLAPAIGLIIHKITDEKPEPLREEGIGLKSHRRFATSVDWNLMFCIQTPRTSHLAFTYLPTAWLCPGLYSSKDGEPAEMCGSEAATQ